MQSRRCPPQTIKGERQGVNEDSRCWRALATSVTFVSKAALKNAAVARLKLAKPLVPIVNTRAIGKRDMKLNDSLPKIEVDPETYIVRADGELLTCEPASELPLAQRYFLF